ncbi:RsmE family RNA methyltransferase [Lentisphaerota bacterium ZTH]|nr:16S rRNA (uracil(1498)-N(3))-methyltransferase [Lentisphaerota bacterium]WET05949.1 RsmE family RNA methyltransferase [Lentisphaerota bacterium ZTH]
MHCFFCKNTGSPGDEAELESTERKHLFKTLRAAPGEQVKLLDGKGSVILAEISTAKNLIILSVNRQQRPRNELHLFLAPPKRQKMDQLLRQCSEVGITNIHPMITQRSVSAPEKVSERWLTLLQEGCKQSGNPFLPEINTPVKFPAAVDFIKKNSISAYFGAVKGTHPSPENISNRIGWIVGPEGGFTENEEEQMLDAGITPLRLGSYVLRVETAAVCGVTLLNFLSNRED